MAQGRTEDLTAPEPPPQAAGGSPVLLLVFPRQRVLPVPLDQYFGRDWLQQRDVVDSKISRAHLTFTRKSGVLHMVDRGSSNGSWHNGSRLEFNAPTRILDGDVIRAGRSLFVYREAFTGVDGPEPPLADLIAPFGLARARKQLEHFVADSAAAGQSRPHLNFLIRGETGTGKELFAKEIARQTGRENNYEEINLTEIATTVFESQVFGHVKGAFTGAHAANKGMLQPRSGGAVFLDEIGDLAVKHQVQLLRFLENRQVRPVGANASTTVKDIVVITATNRNLEEMVATGEFREDLLARLSPKSIVLPPLRERREDIFAIASGHRNYDPDEVEPEAVEHLLLQKWSGNVRELKGALDRVAAHIAPPCLTRWAVEAVLGPLTPASEVSGSQIEQMLQETDGNMTKAANRLGIHYGRVKRHVDKQKKQPRS